MSNENPNVNDRAAGDPVKVYFLVIIGQRESDKGW